MSDDGSEEAAQPLGLPGELRQQVARNIDDPGLINLSATCRTLRTKLVPRLFTSLTLTILEKSARSVALVVSKYGASSRGSHIRDQIQALQQLLGSKK